MPKMFIYGSCVSRDTKNFFSEDWKASTYIARQSMISAAHGETPVEGESKLSSAFQNRMIQFDIQGNAIDLLKSTISEHNLFLIDLVDERRGVYEVSPGKYVTRSYEMVNSKLMKQQSTEPRWIDFGTDEHFNLWSSAARQIIDIAKKSGVPTVAVLPPWSSVGNQGKELLYKQGPVADINKQYERYNAVFVDAGIPVATISETEAIADEKHKWGIATFHYDESVYLKLRDQIMDHYETASA